MLLISFVLLDSLWYYVMANASIWFVLTLTD